MSYRLLNFHSFFWSLQLIFRELAKPDLYFFEQISDEKAIYQPNPNSELALIEFPGYHRFDMELLRFAGRLVGKAMLDGQTIPLHFTQSFYKLMLGLPVTYEDMKGVDENIYNSWRVILTNNLQEIGMDYLTFTYEQNYLGRNEEIELIPGGAQIPVTDYNKREYVHCLAQHRLVKAIQDQSHSFLEGFR